MPARRNITTYRIPQSARQRVLLAREELRAEAEARAAAAEAEAEPMRRWPHPIPTSACPACAPRADGETAAALTQALEKLQYQSQVLTDLLGAVNSLTAAVLCQKTPRSEEI